MSFFKKDKTKEGGEDSNLIDKIKNTKSKITQMQGISRTDKSFSPIALVGHGGKRFSPGFTPDEFYDKSNLTNVGPLKDSTSRWYGKLLETHPYFKGDSSEKFNSVSTKNRWERSADLGQKSKNSELLKSSPYSTRDMLLLFGDTRTDYFRHGLQVIDGKNIDLKTGKSTNIANDGTSFGLRQTNYNTPYENQDPVFFGFEIIIDAVSSPLLNGSVEDFIEQFQNVSEIVSKRNVLKDFKIQFGKLFRLKGTPKKEEVTQKTMSINSPNYANQVSQSNIFEGGRQAYLSYYVKKIGGLENLVIQNTSNKKKYMTDYRNDLLQITFSEDVSLTFGTLAHLYRLLYWSKPNGKNLIPENLLRFNCDIIISECRNYNRVRKAVSTSDVETIKDNLSRHIYQLRECQLFFDKATHDAEIDLEGIKEFPGTTVTMDYKYVSTKFERWTPDTENFGQYVSYNSGAIWKVGNPGARDANKSNENTGTVKDVSIPKFFTIGSNSLKAEGVKDALIFDSFTLNTVKDEPVTEEKIKEKEGLDKDGKVVDQKPSEGDGGEEGDKETKEQKKEKRRAKTKEGWEKFKQATEDAGKKLGNKIQDAVEKELINQVNIRLKLLNDTIDKIRNAAGIGRMRAPTNIYTTHPPHDGMSAERDGYPGVVGGTLPNYPASVEFGGISIGNGLGGSSTFFFDIQNSVRDFAGESIGSVLGQGAGNILKGGNDVGGALGGLFGGGG